LITLTLNTKPVAWAAPVISGRIHFSPKSREKQACMSLVKQLYNGPMLNEYVVADFTFIYSPPKSASRLKRGLMLHGDIIPTKCDATNCQKFFEDCIKNIVITDDRLVAKISSQKLYGEKDQVIIKIWTLKEWREINAISS
jgi:Holliday junction resolvase RusA-like endonuclease